MANREREQIDVELALACREHVYEIFHTLLSGEPTSELLKHLASEETVQALRLAEASFDPRTMGNHVDSTALSSLIQRFRELDAESNETVDRMRSEYMRYLAGPQKQDAQPWESFYMSHRHLLFQESTLKVRDFYRAFGCIPAEYPRVADDHVSLECAFMALLTRRARAGLESGDKAAVREAIDGQCQFLREHLTRWLPLYADAMSSRSGDSLYQEAVVALNQFCILDLAWLTSGARPSLEQFVGGVTPERR